MSDYAGSTGPWIMCKIVTDVPVNTLEHDTSVEGVVGIAKIPADDPCQSDLCTIQL